MKNRKRYKIYLYFFLIIIYFILNFLYNFSGANCILEILHTQNNAKDEYVRLKHIKR